MKEKLPGIKSVAICPTRLVRIDYPRVIDNTSAVTVFGAFEPFAIEGLGNVSVSTEKVSGQTVYTTKLTFFAHDCGEATRRLIDSAAKEPVCFRFTDVNKQDYLIGGEERPFPVVTYEFKNEGNPAGARGYTIEITYINTYSYLIIAP